MYSLKPLMSLDVKPQPSSVMYNLGSYQSSALDSHSSSSSSSNTPTAAKANHKMSAADQMKERQVNNIKQLKGISMELDCLMKDLDTAGVCSASAAHSNQGYTVQHKSMQDYDPKRTLLNAFMKNKTLGLSIHVQHDATSWLSAIVQLLHARVGAVQVTVMAHSSMQHLDVAVQRNCINQLKQMDTAGSGKSVVQLIVIVHKDSICLPQLLFDGHETAPVFGYVPVWRMLPAALGVLPSGTDQDVLVDDWLSYEAALMSKGATVHMPKAAGGMTLGGDKMSWLDVLREVRK